MSWSHSYPSDSTKTSPCSVGFIVPASTLIYGSIFIAVVLNPFDLRILPIAEEATPLPMPDITPPTTKMYFGFSILYLNFKVPPDRKEAGQSAEHNTGADDDKEEVQEITQVIGKNVDYAEKVARCSAEPPRKRVKNKQGDYAGDKPVEHALHHKRRADVKGARADEAHDLYLVSAAVDSQPQGVKRDCERGEYQYRHNPLAQHLGGVGDVLEPLECGAMLSVIKVYFVDDGGAARAGGLLILQKSGYRLVLRYILGLYIEYGAQRIVAQLVERAERQLVVFMALPKLRERLIAREILDF